MPIIPQIPNQNQNQTLPTKKCARCGCERTIDKFAQTRSPFFVDGRATICNDCITHFIERANYNWSSVNKVCQWLDIPFIAREWERLNELNAPADVWKVYSKIFTDDCYEDLGWEDYFNQYKKLKEVGLIDEEIPLVREQKYRDLRAKWGGNYSDEELSYLEDLYKGLQSTQNVNGALQIDQAQKICKFSLEIDNRIRAGDKEVDKFISSYEKLVKAAEFTPKNAKNAIDFDSFAEVGKWLEKRGKQNRFYDGTTRDVIDEEMKNLQNYNQRLYINEGGIGEEISQRLKALQNANEMEKSVYGLETHFDADEFENAGYTFQDEEEEFIISEDTEEV